MLKHFSLIPSLLSGMTTPVEERKVLRFSVKKDARIGIKKTGFFLCLSFQFSCMSHFVLQCLSFLLLFVPCIISCNTSPANALLLPIRNERPIRME